MFIVALYETLEGGCGPAGCLPNTYETPALASRMAQREEQAGRCDGAFVVDVLASRQAAVATAYDVPRPAAAADDWIEF